MTDSPGSGDKPPDGTLDTSARDLEPAVQEQGLSQQWVILMTHIPGPGTANGEKLTFMYFNIATVYL